MFTKEIASELVEVVHEARMWLLNLDETTVRHKTDSSQWSLAEVMGHLVDSACNNHQRFVRAMELETLEFPGYDQNAWVHHGDYHHSDWARLVELWYLYNVQVAQVIRHLREDKLGMTCTIGSYDPCTLEFLVADYLEHLKHHLEKVRQRASIAVAGRGH